MNDRTGSAAGRGWKFHMGWIVAAVLLAGCAGGDGGDTAGPTAGPTGATGPPATATGPTATLSPDGTIEGLFDVGGHSLYLECRGTEAPTVVYIHGSITNASTVPHANGQAFFQLSDEHRVCLYDRRNVGDSDTVDAPQLPEDAIGDLHTLLEVAGVEPPYVLLGASFGGILSYLYMGTYPDEVVGMVLLDAMFPDELELEPLFPPEEQFVAFSEEDENESLERISHFKAIEAAQPFIGNEPAIPATYLASIPEGYEVNDYGIPEYDAQILDLQRQYIERFEPGRYVRVDAPHFMEVAIPQEIVKELRRVIETAGY